VRKYTIVIFIQLNNKKLNPIKIILEKNLKKMKGKKTMQKNSVAIYSVS